MIDIEDYLRSKGKEPRRASEYEIAVECFYHDETPGNKKLYINTDPTRSPQGLHSCFVCGEKGSLNKIRKFFNDTPITYTNDSASDDDLPDDEFCRIMSVAADYYHLQVSENAEVVEYLTKDRGLTIDSIRKHRIGFSDGGLITHLVAEGFDIEAVKKTGIIDAWGNDSLNGMLTIPYQVHGQVVQIRGRRFGEDAVGPKYKTPKGQAARLFNQDATLTDGMLTVAEGELDCIILEQLGFNAVGLPGCENLDENWLPMFSMPHKVVLCLDNDAAGRRAAEKHATTLGPKSRIAEMPEDVDVTDWYVKHGKSTDDFEYLFAKSKGGILVSVRECYDRWLEVEGNPDLVGLKFGIPAFDSQMRNGLLPGQVIIPLAKTGSGKSLTLSEVIPTPSGYMKWGDLVAGDLVFGSDGKPTEVTEIFDRGMMDSYRVTFSDGTSLLTGLDHIWTVNYRYGKYREWHRKDVTTEDLLKMDLRHKNGKEWLLTIPMMEPAEYPVRDFEIQPYTMGSLLANGDMGKGMVVLTTPDKDVIDRVAAEHEIKRYRSPGCPRYGLSMMASKVRKMGLNVKSASKFIPDEYLIGSVEQRVALLQGLMDGDGSKRKRLGKSVLFHTTSKGLASGIKKLVNSLGGTASQRSADRNHDDGRPYTEYTVSIMLPPTVEPFGTKRKGENSRDSNYNTTPRRAIVSVEREGMDQHRCITVAAEDSLYAVTENYILTHNTISTLNVFHRMSMDKPDIKILFISLEQTRNEWFERAQRIHAFYSLEVDRISTIEYWEKRIFLIDENRLSYDQINDAIEQFSFETGAPPDVVAIDYLGYYARGYRGDAYERTSAAVADLKRLAKGNRTVVWVPHQVSRGADFGKELSADMARDSGAVEEYADMIIGLWAPDQQIGTSMADHTNEIHMKILKVRDQGKDAVAVLQFAPLTLAMVPVSDSANFARAKAETQFMLNGDSWEKAVQRHKTGDMDPFSGIL